MRNIDHTLVVPPFSRFVYHLNDYRERLLIERSSACWAFVTVYDYGWKDNLDSRLLYPNLPAGTECAVNNVKSGATYFIERTEFALTEFGFDFRPYYLEVAFPNSEVEQRYLVTLYQWIPLNESRYSVVAKVYL